MPITRTTWVDDSGGGTDGSIINNAELQLIYDAVDDYLGGAGGGEGDLLQATSATEFVRKSPEEVDLTNWLAYL